MIIGPEPGHGPGLMRSRDSQGQQEQVVTGRVHSELSNCEWPGLNCNTLPVSAARVLGEAADYARQGQVAAINWREGGATQVAQQSKD
jgi:hypothetical protein